MTCSYVQAFEVTVRPALDSPTAVLDRLKMGIYTTVRPSCCTL